MKRSTIIVAILLAASGTFTAQAGPWDDIFRGLDILATPSGSPISSSSDGTRVNGARSGRLRIVPNGVVGKGYRLEFDRTFGLDSRGRPETFTFGALGELTLSGSLQATVGYTQTGGLYAGTFDFNANNLSYRLRTKVGVQDVDLSGTFNATAITDINSLGFYTIQLNATNATSELKVDGVLVRDEQPTNFDIGPISLQGNIFVDGAAAVLGTLGIDTTPLQELFPKSPITELTDALTDDLNIPQVAGVSIENELASLMVDSILNGGEDGGSALIQTLVSGALNSCPNGQCGTTLLPEPGTLLLMGLGAAAFWRPRRRR